jgi:hypothetical protein
MLWALYADLWLVSFPHIGATFTRIAFRREDIRRHAWLLVGLPPVALAAVLGIVRIGDFVALNTVYFFWQTFHYVRQSVGIDRAYRHANGIGPHADPLGESLLYLVGGWGMLWRCAERPPAFLGIALWVPNVPRSIATAAALAVIAVFIAWLIRTFRTLDDSSGAWVRPLYLFTHMIIFIVGYVIVRDATRGWLIVNVWHNAQYLLFVWMQNQRRARADGNAPTDLLAWISQPERMLPYAAVCFALGTLAYGTLFAMTGGPRLGAQSATLVIAMQAINFHHYVVDAVIWRRPRSPRQRSRIGPTIT